MWSELIPKHLPCKISWQALEFHKCVSQPYNDAVDGERDSLFAMATQYFKVEGMAMPGLDTPKSISIGGNPVVLMPDVLTKRCFDSHIDIQQTWYFLSGFFDGVIRALGIDKPTEYKEDNERFIRELSKYAAELCLYGKRDEFADWVKEHGHHRIHEHLGHPYSLFGFYLAKSVKGVTAVSYNLEGGMVSSDGTAHPCDIPHTENFPTTGCVIHKIGDESDVKLAEQLIIDRQLGISVHTEMIHDNSKVEDEHGNSINVELISYLMGRPVSAHMKDYYITRRTVALLIRDPKLVSIKCSAA